MVPKLFNIKDCVYLTTDSYLVRWHPKGQKHKLGPTFELDWEAYNTYILYIFIATWQIEITFEYVPVCVVGVDNCEMISQQKEFTDALLFLIDLNFMNGFVIDITEREEKPAKQTVK